MSINSRLVSPQMDRLAAAILSLENTAEVYAFLEDLCTISELHDFGMRLEVAQLLYQGEKYERIEELTGASSATISRVKRSLKFGADGYIQVLKRLERER